MLYPKSLSLAAALLMFPALPPSAATTVSQQTAALPTPSPPYLPIYPKNYSL